MIGLQFLALVFRYGALLMLGISVGGIASGQFAFADTLIGIVFIVVVIGGLSKLIEKLCGILYPKFLDTKGKQRLGDLAVFMIGLLAGFGIAA